MYYVLQVSPGEEIKTEELIAAILPGSLYGECFHLTRLMRKKFRGRWVDMCEKLLPGYVFITTESAEKLFLELKRVPMLTNIVGRDGWSFPEMTACDMQWLEEIKKCGTQKILQNDKTENINGSWYEVGLSQISIDAGNEIRIISGPLKGIEGFVKMVNLHKRMAEVEIPFMNRKTVIYLGVEWLEKKMV